jgi:hypothetical protein
VPVGAVCDHAACALVARDSALSRLRFPECPYSNLPRLELEPQRELNLAAISVGSRSRKDPCRRADVSARKNDQIGCIKIRDSER